MSTTMRAKMKIARIEKFETCERLFFAAVCKSGSYPADGLDEDNTFAKFSPQGDLSITITNPALIGQFQPGEAYYLDFTPVPAAA